jgi:hypothetical protein
MRCIAIEQGVNEITCLEWPQIVNSFADTYVTYRQPGAVCNGDNHASFCRAIELGQAETAHLDMFVESFKLVNGVLAYAGVENQHYLVRGAGKLAPGDAMYLFKFLHKVAGSVLSARRIDNNNVNRA